jgi:hypothetical protein
MGPVVLLMMAGIGAAGCGMEHVPHAAAPVSSSVDEAVRNAMAAALAEASIPSGEDRTMAVQCTGENAGIAFEAAEAVFAPEGWHLSQNMTGFPRLAIRVDSLLVTTRQTLAPRQRGAVEREVAAVLTVGFREEDGLMQEFRVSGASRDLIMDVPGETIRPGSSSTVQSRGGQVFPALLKPAVLGVFMTILVWSLYSYRG